MEIKVIDGFQFRMTKNVNSELLVESKRITETIDYIIEKKVKNIELNSEWGFKFKNIRFIKGISDIIERISIVDDSIDISGIEELSKLKEIYIGGNNNYPLNFFFFKKLQTCNIPWNKNQKNLIECKFLDTLILRKYKHNSENFAFFANAHQIRHLTFIQSTFENLFFLENFKSLEELELYYSPSLKNINGLISIKKTIRKLLIENSKKINSYKSIEALTELEYLGINDSADLPSLDIIQPLIKLKHLSFVGTKVVDGNLSPCTGLMYVGFDDKRHYTHKMKDFFHVQEARR